MSKLTAQFPSFREGDWTGLVRGLRAFFDQIVGVVNFLTITDLIDSTPNTIFPPTDQSGAGIPFSNVSVWYNKKGNDILYYGQFTYGPTASGLVARISTPTPVPNVGRANTVGAVLSSAGAAGLVIQADAGTSHATFKVTPGGGVTNATLNNAIVSFSLTYPAT